MNKPIYCWDSCIFVGWLGGAYALGSLDGVNEIANSIEENRAVLVTCSMIYAEILEGKIAKKSLEKFERFLKRSNVEVVDVDISLIKESGRIRSGCVTHRPKLGAPGASDGIYAATAIKMGATVLHTTDDKLIKLCGHALVGGLIIEIPPSPPQPKLC